MGKAACFQAGDRWLTADAEVTGGHMVSKERKGSLGQCFSKERLASREEHELISSLFCKCFELSKRGVAEYLGDVR